jgi:hypothetical protein
MDIFCWYCNLGKAAATDISIPAGVVVGQILVFALFEREIHRSL